MSTISSGTSVSSIMSISSGPRVPSVPSAPSNVVVFQNPPPTPVPVSRPPPSPVLSSVWLPLQPVPLVRSLPSSLPSPMSESSLTLSSISRSPSIQTVAMPDMPAASEISRPPSVVPTIPSLTPGSSLSSRRPTPRELSASVSSASWTESLEALEASEIASQFGQVPSPSPSFSEPSQPRSRTASERTPTPARSVSTASWIPSSPSVVHNVPTVHPHPHPHPPPSPTPSPWEPSSSSIYTSFVSDKEAISAILSVNYPNAPVGAPTRAPSNWSIKSLRATETDTSFESSLLHPLPSNGVGS
ncbi:hypothetical protein FRC01_012156 [Tulasnella sp. 417]|nr:hypothetical protein FRC01_012156 [Tulasnella sp. 417]